MIRIPIPVSKGYEVIIGQRLIERAGDFITKQHGRCKAAVITDDVVAPLYLGALDRSMRAEGFEVAHHVIENGERSKTFETLGSILEFLGERGLSRSDLIISLGGGVVGDMAGFAAAVYMRGVAYVQIPTTLLAAVDSSVGGKTAVDLRAGKNLAGAFWQPKLVLCDPDVLSALPDPLIRDGAAEIVKYGVIADAELFALVAEGIPMHKIDSVVARCVSIKRDFVVEDEFDEGKRQMLNLGHTFGHAVEKLSGYAITHGQAVAMGMVAAARAAEAIGVAVEPCSKQIIAALEACGLPVSCPFDADRMKESMIGDKKRRGGRITLVVPERIGRCVLVDVALEELNDWIVAGGIASHARYH